MKQSRNSSRSKPNYPGIHRRIIMVGAFPPPVQGMPLINAAIRDRLRSMGAKPQVINLSALNLDRSFPLRLRRLPKVLRGIVRLIRIRGLHGGTFYISVSGGFGKLYEIAFVSLARLRGMRVFLHHHTYKYLENLSLLAMVLTWAAGSAAAHITLSPGMAKRLKTVYHVKQVIPISNAVFFNPPTITDSITLRRRLETLGFLSNIAPEKGVLEFLDLHSITQDLGLQLRAKLAGPFNDRTIERHVRSRLATLQDIEYVGPRYGTEKEAFFASIDALIFPTRYANEAEPLVIHEAMRCGVPVIAYGRGCIPEIMDTESGKVVHMENSFISESLTQILAWLFVPSALEAASAAAARQFLVTNSQNERRLSELLSDLINKRARSLKEAAVSNEQSPSAT